jgi:hypothetical protein
LVCDQIQAVFFKRHAIDSGRFASFEPTESFVEQLVGQRTIQIVELSRFVSFCSFGDAFQSIEQR